MAETSIAADVAPAQPATWPLLRKLRNLVTRLRAAQRAREFFRRRRPAPEGGGPHVQGTNVRPAVTA